MQLQCMLGIDGPVDVLPFLMTHHTKRQELNTAPLARFQPHPLVKDIAILPRESEDYERMAASIEAVGIIDPLKCVKGPNDSLLVLDGLHRLSISAELSLKELPYCLVDSQELVDIVCLSSVRANWTKSALAYRLWPFFAEQKYGRGGDRKSKGNDFPLKTSAEIGAKIGISEKLVDQAKSAHAYFAKHPAKRAELEPRILTGQLPLHKLENGRNGAAGGREKAPLLAILDRLKPLPAYFEKWGKMNAETKRRTTDVFVETLLRLPDEVQEAAFDALEVKLKP